MMFAISKLLVLTAVAVLIVPIFAAGDDIPWGLDSPPKRTEAVTGSVTYAEVLDRVKAGDVVAIFVGMPVDKNLLPADLAVTAFARCDEALDGVCGDGSKIKKGMCVCFKQQGSAVLIQRHVLPQAAAVTPAKWSTAWQTTAWQTTTTTTTTQTTCNCGGTGFVSGVRITRTGEIPVRVSCPCPNCTCGDASAAQATAPVQTAVPSVPVPTTFYTTQPSRFGLFRSGSSQSTCVGGNCPK